jgi:hypothetical protein
MASILSSTSGISCLCPRLVLGANVSSLPDEVLSCSFKRSYIGHIRSSSGTSERRTVRTSDAPPRIHCTGTYKMDDTEDSNQAWSHIFNYRTQQVNVFQEFLRSSRLPSSRETRGTKADCNSPRTKPSDIHTLQGDIKFICLSQNPSVSKHGRQIGTARFQTNGGPLMKPYGAAPPQLASSTHV